MSMSISPVSQPWATPRPVPLSEPAEPPQTGTPPIQTGQDPQAAARVDNRDRSGHASQSSRLAGDSSAVAEFLKWARMSPAERIRAQYLEREGLTEDQLARLPDDEREKIELAIQKQIRNALGGEVDTGSGHAAVSQANQAYRQAQARIA